MLHNQLKSTQVTLGIVFLLHTKTYTHDNSHHYVQ